EPSAEESATAPRARNGKAPSTSTKTKSSNLSEEQARRLALASQGLDRDVGGSFGGVNLDRAPSGGNAGEGLNAQQLSSVVQRNRPALQRCYENAIRGSNNAPSLRLDVRITVGTTGRVTSVNVGGQGVGNLNACIESTVRRWVFPQSGRATSTSFPLVLTPGS